jgi:hypothetical protein
MQIPKKMSRPADPSKHSFLDRPGEIRNRIYGILFKRDEPVLLHNAKAYHAVEPKRRSYQSDENFHSRLSEFDSHYELEIGRDHEFVHDFHLGLSILLVSRQIYHEAAGVLYKDNTFVVSRVLCRHDRDFHEFHDDMAYHQINYAPQWLSNIGSQFSMLRKVIIDCDAICDPACDEFFDDFDILPLLRLLWKYSIRVSPVTFARTGRILEPRCARNDQAVDMEENERTRYANSQIKNLNAIISSVIGNGDLSLKRYARFDRLITSASLYIDDVALVVDFESNPSPPYHYQKEFSARDGNVIVRTQVPTRKSFFDLPNSLLLKIFRMAAGSPSTLIVDTDRRTAYGLDFNILQLNRWSRNYFSSIIGQDIDLTIVQSSIGVTNDPVGCRTLGKLMDFSAMSFMVLYYTASMTIALKFQVVAPTIAASLRIDIKRLVSFMRDMHFKDKTTISITFERYGEGLCAYLENSKVFLPDLARQLFLLLSDGIQNQDFSHAQETCEDIPNIYMDGYGKISSASCASSSTGTTIYLENRHAKLSASEVKFRGYRFADELSDQLPHNRHSLGFRNELHMLWAELRNHYWPDWRTHRR